MTGPIYPSVWYCLKAHLQAGGVLLQMISASCDTEDSALDSEGVRDQENTRRISQNRHLSTLGFPML